MKLYLGNIVFLAYHLLHFCEGRLCINQSMNCVCSNKIIQRMEVQIALQHLLEKGMCTVKRPVDCEDVYNQGHRNNDVYRIYPQGQTGYDVYCDMTTDGGGWTVIQRRYNGATDFYRTWTEYQNGFGDIGKEYWLGNDKIHHLTTRHVYKPRVDLEDFKGVKVFATYSNFSIGSNSSGYVLEIGSYHGDAGDSLTYHKGHRFFSKDADNSNGCAVKRNGAWWYDNCYYSNLNGLYMQGKTDPKSMFWFHFRKTESLKSSEMKVKRIK